MNNSRTAKILSLCRSDNGNSSESPMHFKNDVTSAYTDFSEVHNSRESTEVMPMEGVTCIREVENNPEPLEETATTDLLLLPSISQPNELFLSKNDPVMVNISCEKSMNNHLSSEPTLDKHDAVPEIGSNNLSDFEDYQESESSYRPSNNGSSSPESDFEIKEDNKENNSEGKKVKRIRSRKGQANKELWSRRKNQVLREKGQEYVSQTKRSMNARKMGPRCDSKTCARSKLRKCNLLNDEDRKLLFSYFWNELDWNGRKAYIKTLISCISVVQKTTKKKSRRRFTLGYSVKVNEDFLPVCKKMFLSTFNIKEWSVRSWVTSKKIIGEVNISNNEVESEKEISKTNKNSAKTDSARTFLLQLPKMPSHYARSSSSKSYLEPLYQSYADLYRVYITYCKENDIKEVLGNGRFRMLFQEMNLGLFQPKKDQCDLCVSQKLNAVSLDIYEKHIAQKDRARAEKVQDKVEALNGKFTLLTADVQSIQLVPFTPASSIYFKQKLVCRNYTICNLVTKKVVCYVWHECNGGSEANNFASCLLDFLDKELSDQERQEVILFTDGCNAQNRNTILANALQYYVNTKNVLITQKFLVKGHTQMECDSVHATIERRKKNRELYAPANFVELIKQSRIGSPGPYNVKYVDYNFFINYSDISYYNSIRPGKKAGDPVVNDIRALRYSAENDLQYKTDFNADWQALPQRKNKSNGLPKPLYSAPQPISKSKYDSLQSLKPIILKDYHAFYDALPHTTN